MTWIVSRFKYERLVSEIEPSAKITTKDSWVWSSIWFLLVFVTLGLFMIKMSRNDFLNKWATTIGPIQAYPRAFSSLSLRLLVHECRHTTQCVVASLFVPILGWIPWRRWRAWVGLLPMGLSYLILPFPIYFCYGRYRLELDADIKSWEWALKNGYSRSDIRVHALKRITSVSGGSYFWPWPKALIKRGYSIAFTKVTNEILFLSA